MSRIRTNSELKLIHMKILFLLVFSLLLWNNHTVRVSVSHGLQSASNLVDPSTSAVEAVQRKIKSVLN